MGDVELVDEGFGKKLTKDTTHRVVLIFLKECAFLKRKESITFGEDKRKDPAIFHIVTIILDPNNRRIDTK